VSGLSAAFYLERAAGELALDFQVTLLEKSHRLGGVIQSETLNGLLFEGGPEGWASYKPAGKKLVQELGLEDELIGSRDEFRKTLIVRDGQLTSLPDGMMFLAPVDPWAFWRTAPMSLSGKLRASLEPLVTRSSGDLSIRRFFERRLGREFTRKLVEPLISAVYGSDFEELSAPSSLPELYRAEQRAGSLWWGLRRFANMSTKISVLVTMKQGMQQLTDHLESQLNRTRIVCESGEIQLERPGSEFIVKSNGFEDRCDFVVLCTPAAAAGQIVSKVSLAAAGLLKQVPYGSSTLVYLVYDKKDFDHPLDGFGFIVPRKESRMVDACTWVNTKFDYRAPGDKILLRCAIHARDGRSLPTADQAAEVAAEEIKAIMGVQSKPIDQKIFRVEGGIPQLLVGHQQRLREVQQELSQYPGLILAGSFSGGVGVPDCIKTARETATAIAAEVSGRG
jgi:oxygen-dependent protoporphyrinogen oxidase